MDETQSFLQDSFIVKDYLLQLETRIGDDKLPVSGEYIRRFIK